MELMLAVPEAFSLSAVMKSHGWIDLLPFGKDAQTEGLTYITRLRSRRVAALLIQQTLEGVSITLDGSLTDSEYVEVSKQVRWMLGLDQDFTGFYALIRKEPKLAQAETRAQGRLLRSASVFEDAVKTLLTTNTSWAGTKRMVEALVVNYGSPLPVAESASAFPSPEQLASVDVEALRTTARLGYRAPYVAELAQAVTSGTLDLESLKTTSLTTSALHKYLMSIKGVGAYAAASMLMLLGRYDFVPVDSWAHKLVSHEWYGGEPVTKAQIEQAFERWEEWKGLAYWFWDWAYAEEE